MNNNSCCICFENYVRDINPPMLCNPCGHDVCKPCLEQWFRTSSRKTCPHCRTPITHTTINRSLMDILESRNNNIGNTDDNYEVNETLFKSKKNSNKVNEIILDKCREAYYIIDNSLSMEECDGKIFSRQSDGNLKIIYGVTRWLEACQKVAQIAKYNINRKMVATYYILNPKYRENWVENRDYICIDPDEENSIDKKLETLQKKILSQSQIRGNTPLDVITNNLYDELSRKSNLDEGYYINFNIITDGCPNSNLRFELSLKKLSHRFPVFLTINLCTEDDYVVEYYNELDKTIGNELSGMDVLDDYKSEAYEICRAGNTFFTYTEEIHICRMAGCFSVVSDLLDEQKLSVFHANKLVKEILNLPSSAPHWTDLDSYMNEVNMNNEEVYDINTNRMKPLINTFKLNTMIHIYLLNKNITDLYNENKILFKILDSS